MFNYENKYSVLSDLLNLQKLNHIVDIIAELLLWG